MPTTADQRLWWATHHLTSQGLSNFYKVQTKNVIRCTAPAWMNIAHPTRDAWWHLGESSPTCLSPSETFSSPTPVLQWLMRMPKLQINDLYHWEQKSRCISICHLLIHLQTTDHLIWKYIVGPKKTEAKGHCVPCNWPEFCRGLRKLENYKCVGKLLRKVGREKAWNYRGVSIVFSLHRELIATHFEKPWESNKVNTVLSKKNYIWKFAVILWRWSLKSEVTGR